MTFPNFFTDPGAYNRLKIGGVLIKAVLREVDGIKLEATWDAQKATGTSGPTWVFKGMQAAGPHDLTLECGNGPDFTAAESYDELRALYERFGPVPTNTGGPITKDSPYTIGQTKNADAGGKIPVNPLSAKTTDSDGFPKSTGTNPGPKPPTLSVENAFLAYVGTTAISMKAWDGPKPTATGGIRVKLTVIPQKPPVKAGTGVAPAKLGDKFSIGSASPTGAGGGGTGGAAAADKAAAQAGAGT